MPINSQNSRFGK